MTEEQKKQIDIARYQKEIDGMSHEALCRYWRFAKCPDPLLQGEVGEYFKHRLFNHFGGFTPEISKKLGW